MLALDEAAWARDMFGDAELGDVRRTERLVKLATAAAKRPAGTVTKVIRSSAEREAAYRLLENDRVSPREIARVVGATTARKCTGHDWIYVAVDQTTLSFIDRKQSRDLGRVADGAFINCRGLEVINGLAVDANGRTVGMCTMQWTVRTDQRAGRRAPEDRESQMWIDALTDTEECFREHAPKTTLWFQLDAGADHSRNFAKVIELGHHVTIRCAHNRIIRTADGPGKLLDEVARQRVLGHMTIHRKESGSSKKRQVRLSVRSCPVTTMLLIDGQREPVDLCIVQVREVGRVPKSRERICWNLLTTYAVEDLDDAREVITGYTMRWRIEDFYRTWKNGHCRLEDSQLRSRGAILRWAIVLAAVAARIERIKHRSRNEPEASASSEFSRNEIDAAIMLSETKKWKPGDDPELGPFVTLVAELGGYTGKSSGGPPGSVTIARGLDWITPAALLLGRTRQDVAND